MTESDFHKEMSLNNWSDMFREIYFPTQNYNRSKIEIFTHLIKVFGGGSRYLFRTSDADGSRDYLAKIFGWYCALANRLSIDLEDTIWQKYPGVCPRCLEHVCNCERTPKDIDPAKLAVLAASHRHQKPRSLREWQTMFANIYRSPSGGETIAPSRDRLAMVFSRMAEELGEVAEAILLDDAIDHDVGLVVRNEMADLCAWIFALANNLQFVDPTATGVTLADVSWNLYGGKCHRCQKLPCICVRGSFGLELAQQGAMGPSHWDDRTGLANAEALRVQVQAVEEQFKRKPTPWSFIMFDLDDFGKVNKTHGNLVGDIVLKTAAERMRSVLSNKELAFRRGGEEFVVLLERDQRDALVLAERIRRALAHSPVTARTAKGELQIDVRASFGVASTFADSRAPSELEDVADSRMRQAKLAGKNRIEPDLSEDLRNWMATRQQYE
ncbi:MAG TPA: diguanylate cyclase [Ideonella sp.]|uniref:diguanylate cyclase n=1 Tax=Ideonella sp. TaxID=1929293 RepID=UPI002E35CED5|nr:diguanylate cyclase [Ideonella sp.]HEX5682744.1 diguanylate cyclase [Ideonella sp.]